MHTHTNRWRLKVACLFVLMTLNVCNVPTELDFGRIIEGTYIITEIRDQNNELVTNTTGELRVQRIASSRATIRGTVRIPVLGQMVDYRIDPPIRLLIERDNTRDATEYLLYNEDNRWYVGAVFDQNFIELQLQTNDGTRFIYGYRQ
ncbi:hypothetical protein [Eisenibacter elegans]|uniref:hypothetical protein n=1 Tax=Eisenibacter elegans TaxID=997 RepID=UPI000407A46C|nr:hypothetical protein [Eisenibacter elegans]